jgi:hypothetical protein
MKRIEIELTGTAPMMVHKMTDEAELTISKGTNKATLAGSNGTAKEQAEKYLYLTSDNKPMLPGFNVLKGLIKGGRFVKIGRGMLSTKTGSSQLIGCVNIIEDAIIIQSKDGWTVDTRTAVNPKTKGRMVVHRPKFNEWSIKFHMEIDDEVFAPDLIRKVIDHAGKRIGLGSYRPECNGPFGTFHVTNWKIGE